MKHLAEDRGEEAPESARNDAPCIVNRSDALEALNELIEEADMDGTSYRRRSLRALKDALERGFYEARRRPRWVFLMPCNYFF